MVGRVRRQLTAWIALAAFAAGLLLPISFARHSWTDDPDLGWGEPQLVNRHPVTQIEAVRPAAAAEHCAICHWLRALGSSVTSAKVRHPVLAFAGTRQSSLPIALVAAVRDCAQARAPPRTLA